MMEVQATTPTWSRVLIFFARLFSILLHPLLVGVFAMFYLVFIHPEYFISMDARARLFKFFTFANNNFILPLLVVLLLRGLGFSKSIYLRTQKERIIPYIACITFFFWTFYVFKNQPETPQIVVDLCQGMFLSSCISLILNNYFKISMHAIAMGGILGVMVSMVFEAEAYSAWPIIITLILTAVVCSSRKIASDHSWFDIIAGLCTGFLMQGIAWWL